MATYAFDHNVFPHLKGDLARVEKLFMLQPDGHSEISTVVQHLFGDVPKLVRPTLALMSAYTWGTDCAPANDRVIEAAALIEFTHVGTMCHDDVIDEAPTRRRRPSVNARWGNAIAILAGDFLLSTASEFASRLGLKECEITANTYRSLCTGQMTEILDLYSLKRTEEAYLRAIVGKTAMLLSSACRLGALETKACDAAIENAAQFGLYFGIAFQINDDLLDLTESSEALGKESGKDVLEGVYTLPTIYALRQSAELREMLSSPLKREDVATMSDIVAKTGALTYAAQVAERHMRTAERLLFDGLASVDGTQVMIDFARGMLGAVARFYDANFVAAPANLETNGTDGPRLVNASMPQA